jgi:hypothetical protein
MAPSQPELKEEEKNKKERLKKNLKLGRLKNTMMLSFKRGHAGKWI